MILTNNWNKLEEYYKVRIRESELVQKLKKFMKYNFYQLYAEGS